MNLITNIFDLLFFQNVLTTFLGALFGIPVALWVDRLIKRSREKKDRKQLIDALTDSLDKNIELLKKLKSKIGVSPNDYYPSELVHDLLDLTILNSTSVTKYELLGSISTCQSVDKARYELMNLDIRLKLLRRIAVDLSISKTVGNFAEQIISSCEHQLSFALQALDKAKTDLRSII